MAIHFGKSASGRPGAQRWSWMAGSPVLPWLVAVLAAEAILLLSRLVFLFFYYPSFAKASAGDIAHAFLVGFRFDFATALITVAPPLLLLSIPLPKNARKGVTIISSALAALLLSVMSFFLWGDLLFYSESSRHFTFEPSGVTGDLKAIAQMILDDYLPALVSIVIFLSGLIWLGIRFAHWSGRLEERQEGRQWKRVLITLPLLMVTFVGARGGIQKEPLKSADAVVSQNPTVSNLALNGWYSFLTEMTKVSRPSKLMPHEEARQIIRDLIAIKGDRFVTDESPLLRENEWDGKIVGDGEKLNVVLMVIESLNAEFLQSFGGSEEVMPFLDSIARESVRFTNFQAVATRSFRGLCAILASYPNLSPDAYSITFRLPEMAGLGRLMEGDGYDVRFMHAAAENSMGITAISRLAGYREFVSAEAFPKNADNGSWGVWDHIALERMTEEMDAMREPLHYGIFTLCTHSPWKLPEGYAAKFDKSHPRGEILNTFVYADKALRKFFEREAQRERFGRTLYVIVGDHTTHASEEERFRVGCLFYAPGRLEPMVDSTLSSQLDLLPSIMHLAGIETPHASFGRSLFAEEAGERWAVMLQSDLLYWRQGERILTSSLAQDFALFDVEDMDVKPMNYLYTEAATASLFNRRLAAMYQLSETLAEENRLLPR